MAKAFVFSRSTCIYNTLRFISLDFADKNEKKLKSFRVSEIIGQHRAIAWHENSPENSAVVCIKEASDYGCVLVVNMDDIGRKEQFGKHGKLECEVRMDCSTHVLCVHCPIKLSEPCGIDDSPEQKLLLYMEGISVSLVNKARMELLHGFMGALTCNCIIENENVNVNLKIQRFQVTQQPFIGVRPCLQ
jgi:hypothetical protein